MWGGDIKLFHPPVDVFEGIIGGPPCQEFSHLRSVNAGRPSKWGNMIPEFERVVTEGQPTWFVMENVDIAPIPSVNGYRVYPALLNNRLLGESQNRVHRFSFGTRTGSWLSFNVAVEQNKEWAPRVCASGGVKPGRPRGNQTSLKYLGWKTVEALRESLRLQGLPADFLDESPFTLAGKHSVIGNAVSLPMARALAKAVRRATNTK